jgi:hypothetical protein
MPAQTIPRYGLKRGAAALARGGLLVGIGVLGVVMVHHPMIFSGFRRIQTSWMDSRLIHYLLEYGYRALCSEPSRWEFWNPPFYYPAANAMAYSDTLLGVGPVYWLWRTLGASADLSICLWMLSMSALNYAAGLLLFRRGLGFGVPAAAAGASLIAFGAPRVNQMDRQQLLPCFYMLVAAYALARLARDRQMGAWSRAGFWFLAMAGTVAQLYSGVYLGWFFIVGVGAAAVAALALRSCRGAVLQMVWRDWWAILAAGLVGGLMLQPFLAHYLQAAHEVSGQFVQELHMLQPRFWSWVDTGGRNWLWGWLAGRAPFHSGREAVEHHLGIGFVTSLACAVGLYLNPDRPVCRLAALVTFLFWLATTLVPGDMVVVIATAVGSYCAACLFRKIEDTRSRAIGLAVVVGLFVLVRFPNPYLQELGLTVIILCLLEMGRVKGRTLDWVVPGIAVAALSLKLFVFSVILLGATPAAVLAGAFAYVVGPHHRLVGVGSLACLVLFPALMTFADRPDVLLGALALAALSLALSAPRRLRAPAWLSLRALVIALPLVVMFYGSDSLWIKYSGIIPGAIAIRAVGRIILLLLIPAALGLASTVQWLEERRSAALAWIVGLVCLAEQGVTTTTLDAAANRATIAALASRVEPGRAAFYYHPCEDRPTLDYHLDAMWASLDRGVPTINGYSGHSPRDWADFFQVDFEGIPGFQLEVEDVLREWERKRGLSPDRIQWIGADCPRRRRKQSAKAPIVRKIPGDRSERAPGQRVSLAKPFAALQRER